MVPIICYQKNNAVPFPRFFCAEAGLSAEQVIHAWTLEIAFLRGWILLGYKSLVDANSLMGNLLF